MRASPKVPFGRSCQDRCTRSTTTARRLVFLLITWNFISRRFPCHVLCRLLLGQNRQILKTRVGCVFTSPFEHVIYFPLRRLLAQNSWNEEDHTDYDCAVGGLFWTFFTKTPCTTYCLCCHRTGCDVVMLPRSKFWQVNEFAEIANVPITH